jgi:LSD1 subclass zinc finger protein
MKARVLVCECCGAALNVPAAATHVRCEYCGTLAAIEALGAKTHAVLPRPGLALPSAEMPESRPRALPDRPGPGGDEATGWAALGVGIVIICTMTAALVSGAAAVGVLLLVVLALFLGGTLMFVSAHLIAAQSADATCEEHPIEARPRDEYVRAGEEDAQ